MRIRDAVPQTVPQTYEVISFSMYDVQSIYFFSRFLIEYSPSFSKSIKIASYDEEKPFTEQYTNYTIGFKDCLDYIFYDENSFSVTQVGIILRFAL